MEFQNRSRPKQRVPLRHWDVERGCGDSVYEVFKKTAILFKVSYVFRACPCDVDCNNGTLAPN